MQLVDVTTRLAEPALSAVLALSVGSPTPQKLADLNNLYGGEPSWFAYGCFAKGQILGISGLELGSRGTARLRHIAVRPESQRGGIGGWLIGQLIASHSLVELYAETHAGATQFYESRGFSVASLGELYPGVERFSCTWRAAQLGS